jgi:hypothetical protein
MSIPRFWQIVHEETGAKNKQNFYLGEVSSINPLKVRTNDIELDNDQLRSITSETLVLNKEVLLVKVGSFFIILGIVRSV